MSRNIGRGQPGPRKWLGIGIRVLATLFFLLLLLALSRCKVADLVGVPPTVTEAPPDVATVAYLAVEVRPHGARILLDGQLIGPTPLSVTVSPGRHEVRVELEGYEPLVVTAEIDAGGQFDLIEDLVPLPSAPTATFTPETGPTEGPDLSLPDLAVRQATIELETGGACDFASTQLGVRVVVENTGSAAAGPFVVEVNGVQQPVEAGLAPGQAVSLWFSGYNPSGEDTIVLDAGAQVEESSEDNNRFSQRLPVPTLPPTCTPLPADAPTSTSTSPPPPTSTPTPVPPTVTPSPLPPTAAPPPPSPPPPAAVTVTEGQITIPTYPYRQFMVESWNEAYNMAYSVFDRSAYEGSGPLPDEVVYRTLTLENDYLRLTFLPEVGGRLYEVFYKPTGHLLTYRNPVLKPSPWGPAEQGGWLAAGGIEWCFPVEEHGYEWGIPWAYQVQQDADGATVLLSDSTEADRVRLRIAVRLEPGAGYFTIRPRLENPTRAPVAVKYWTNAMLAPGGQNAPSAGLQFVLPDAVTAVTVHNRGDDSLPEYGQRMTWPIFNGVDLSRLGNWNRWLGFFEDPAVGEFMAVYDPGFDEGMVRVFPAGVAQGAKVFAFGWNDPLPSTFWTDDGSGYVEIHGGPAATFDDTVSLPAGGQLEWTETWYPVAGLGGLRYANPEAALNLAAGGGQVQAAVAVNRPWSGSVALLLDEQERWLEVKSLVPGQAFQKTISLQEDDPQIGRLALRLEDPIGGVVAEYSADFNLK